MWVVVTYERADLLKSSQDKPIADVNYSDLNHHMAREMFRNAHRIYMLDTDGSKAIIKDRGDESINDYGEKITS